MIQTLIKDTGYEGRYVALKSFDDYTIICDGLTPQEVYEKAKQLGYTKSVLIFVPLKDIV